MANARRDDNRVTTVTGVLNSDGTTISNVLTDPSVHACMVHDASTGSDNGPSGRALHDGNTVTTLIAASEVDGATPVALYVNSDGELLVDSN